MKELLGALATAIALVAYIIYTRELLHRKIRPHAFSWFVWSVIQVTTFNVQISQGAGPGSWITGLALVACIIIFFLSLRENDKRYPLFDWVSLGLAIVAFTCWRFAHAPILATIFVVLSDSIGYLPTIRKGLRLPHEEQLTSFVLWGLSSAVAITAMKSYSLATWLSPAASVAMSALLIIGIFLRRIEQPTN